MRIAIIGAGLTGMSAALNLKEYAKVVLFEKSTAGGLAASYCKHYCIEKFYHHCFKQDKALLETIRKLGLSSKLVWRTVRIGYAVDDRIYPLNTPLEVLRYPYMSFGEKARLAFFMLKSRKRRYELEDDVGVVEGLKRELGESLLENFFLPLLKGKFGELYSEVSYAWLLARVAIRSNRKYGGEELGYLRHGFYQLIERMKDGLELRSKEVKRIEKNGKLCVNNEKFDAVIYTAPLPRLDERIRIAAALPEIKYQSSVCALIGAKESITEDIYWTNIKDRVFGAIIEHTHFMPFEDYGEHLIYLASYSTPNGWLYKASDEELKKIYLRDVQKFGLKSKAVNWIEIFKAKYSGPIYERGYLKKLTPYRTKLDGFYVAGMTSRPSYPERSMNGSIEAGFEVAENIKKDFGFEAKFK
jgi:protoporphyrinogen oxidase